MNLSDQLAKHFRDVHFGGNWTEKNYRETLNDVTWRQAQQKLTDLNSIATLAVHVKYFIPVVTKVFRGGSLQGKDTESFNYEFIQSEADWEKFKLEWWDEAEVLAKLIEQFPEDHWFNDFVHPKYGTYYQQVHGMIEHAHYHLGQISLIKKMI